MPSASSSSSSPHCRMCQCTVSDSCSLSTCPFCEVDATDFSFSTDIHDNTPIASAFKDGESGMESGTGDSNPTSCGEAEDLDADDDGNISPRDFGGGALERQNEGEPLRSNRAIIPYGLAEPLAEVSGETDAEVSIQSLADLIMGPALQVLIRQILESEIERYGSPPASKAAIEAMPFLTVGEQEIEGSQLQCAVCREAFKFGGEVRKMPCKHVYHNECILPWLNLHSSCPLCRHEMPVEAVTCSRLSITEADSEVTDNSRIEDVDDEHLAALIAIVGNNDRVLCLIVLEFDNRTIRATFREAREVEEVEARHETDYTLTTSRSPSTREVSDLSPPDELGISASEASVLRSASSRTVDADFLSGIWNQGLFSLAFGHRGSSRTRGHFSTHRNRSATDDFEDDNWCITERRP